MFMIWLHLKKVEDIATIYMPPINGDFSQGP